MGRGGGEGEGGVGRRGGRRGRLARRAQGRSGEVEGGRGRALMVRAASMMLSSTRVECETRCPPEGPKSIKISSWLLLP